MRVLLLITGIALATSGFAESTKESNKSDDRKSYTESMFQKMDTDQDGNISKAEYEAGLREKLEKRMKHFSTMDADGDGLMSKTEATEAKMRMKAKWKNHHSPCNKADN